MVPSPITTTESPRTIGRRVSARQTTAIGSMRTASSEVDVIVQAVDQFRGHADAFGERTGTSETDLVVDLAAIGRAASALHAVAARDDALDDDTRPGGANVVELIDEFAHPLVPEHERVADVRGID